jgi:hypothetical protein
VRVLNSRQQNARQLPLLGLAGNNPASYREKIAPTSDLIWKVTGGLLLIRSPVSSIQHPETSISIPTLCGD